MSISADDVLKVARLAKLHVAAEALAPLAGQLSRIVEMVEQLKSVKTEGVEPLAHAMDLHSVLREDIVRASLSREAALANAPQHDAEFFRVPPVM
jgi:aspartyl-tRNA(Asn)/glutamyl-tRNA(Gln) amidotransferase subunit C